MQTVLLLPIIPPDLIFSLFMRLCNWVDLKSLLWYLQFYWLSLLLPNESCYCLVQHLWYILSHHTATSPASRFHAQQEVSAIRSTLRSEPLQSPVTTPSSLGAGFRFLFTTTTLDKSEDYSAISQILQPGERWAKVSSLSSQWIGRVAMSKAELSMACLDTRQKKARYHWPATCNPK